MNRMQGTEKIEINGNISLHIRDNRIKQNEYASCRIQKGLLLSVDENDLSEEGVGFGVPILKFKDKEIFPGSARITTSRDGDKTTVTIDYDLNLVERMTMKGNKIDNRAFYRMKEYMSRLHRECPCIRQMLTQASNTLRFYFGMETRFEEVTSFGIVSVLYVIHAGNIHINVDTSRVKKYDWLMLMNEQGANNFDEYQDSSGLALKGNAIGTWEETFADGASFVDASHKLEFTLQKVAGAKLFRGRELVPGRLAWAGLAYSIPQGTSNFYYNIRTGCK